jgi:hypothetical protein
MLQEKDGTTHAKDTVMYDIEQKGSAECWFGGRKRERSQEREGNWLTLMLADWWTWADGCVGNRRLVSPAQSPVEPWTTFRIYRAAGVVKSLGQDVGWKGLEHQRGISFSCAAAVTNHSPLAR